MIDAAVSSAQGPEWVLLWHQLPPEPAYLRVKVRRRLQRLGAVGLRNAVYALPRTDETVEDFQWLAREIQDAGAEATVCLATFVFGLSDAELRDRFRAERETEVVEVLEAARALAGGDPPEPADVARLRRRLEEIAAMSHLGAPSLEAAQRAVEALERPGAPTPRAGRGRTWVTRAGVFVDRIASAWLISRFIDPDARFRFVARGDPLPQDALRFDMFGGDYTHRGDLCTYEVLLEEFGIRDRAARLIGEIVHDIDCKDEKFGRPEAAGIAMVLRGLATSATDDAERVARGAHLFDALHEQLSSGR